MIYRVCVVATSIQAPGLTLLALFSDQHDRLPVAREDEARAGVGDFDAMAQHPTRLHQRIATMRA
jgi:hypothetical protein